MVTKHCAIGFIVLLSLSACGDDGGDGNTAGTGASGMGAMAGTGTAGTGTAGTGTAGAGTAGTGTAGTGGGAAPGSPTFSAIFEEIIVGTGCNGGALCHGGTVGMLDMNDKQATYDALVNVPAMGMNLTGMPPHCADSGLTRVVPGDPDASLLVQKVERMQTCGDAMPPGASMLPVEQQQQIRMWVQMGAMND